MKKGIVLSLIAKILYDFVILECLPEVYIWGISYGVNNIDLIKIFLGYLVYIIVSFVSHRTVSKRGAYDLMITVLFYLYYVPLSSSFYLNDQSYVFFFLTHIYWLLLVTVSKLSDRIKKHDVRVYSAYNSHDVLSNKMHSAFMTVIVIGCIFYGYKFNGLSLTLDIIDIYDSRSAFVGTTNMLESFLFNFGGNIVVPIFILHALNKKNTPAICIGVFAQLVIFSIGAQKSQILILIVAFAIGFIKNTSLFRRIHSVIPYAFIGLLLVSYLETVIVKTSMLFTMLIRRLMYIPSWITTLYYDFFLENPKLLWLQDVCMIDKLGLGRYDESVLELINNNYFRGLMPSPNTGLFAEAYMHFGLVGVIIYPLLFVVIMKWLYNYIEAYDMSVQVYLTYAISMALISIPVTSGVFVLTYIMFIPYTIVFLKVRIASRRKKYGTRSAG